jgi:hypothetical protein
VPAVGQCGGDHLGDVVGVDERLSGLPDRQHDLAGQDRGQEEALAEVLVEEAGPDDGPLRSGLAHDRLGSLGRRLAPTGQEDQPGHTSADRLGGEGRDGLRGPREGEVGLVADVDRTDAVQGSRPGVGVLPVERRLRGAGADPHGSAAGGEQLRDPPAGLAGAAEDQDGLGGGLRTG